MSDEAKIECMRCSGAGKYGNGVIGPAGQKCVECDGRGFNDDPRIVAVATALASGWVAEAKYYISEAKAAIAASDAVMLSDANLERMARESWNMLAARDGGRQWDDIKIDGLHEMWAANVRVVLEAAIKVGSDG